MRLRSDVSDERSSSRHLRSTRTCRCRADSTPQHQYETHVVKNVSEYAAALLPARGLSREACRKLRLARRFRLRVAGGFCDLAFELFLVGQPGRLIDEHQRVLGGNLEFLPTGLARNFVIEPQEVIAQLRELGAVRVVGACGRAV